MDEYAPPKHVMDLLRKQCDCCQVCSDVPCAGVMAGGPCDSLNDSSCECDEDDPAFRCYYCGQDGCDCDML